MTSRMATLCLTVLAGAAVAQQPAAAQGESATAKVQQLVQGSGYSNRHPKPTAWILAAKGPAIGNHEVFVAVSGDIVVIGAVAAKKAQMPMTPAFLQTLLRSNHDMDFVKVGLDGDGDAFDPAATDAVYTRIKPYLK
jgi:hypothetical protein